VLETVDSITAPIEFVHMDGFPHLNLDVLKKLESKLASDSVIITDDVNLFRLEMSDYIDVLMNSGKYSSVILPVSTGVMISIKNSI
jgi:predicted O-methyltransferase YrrM